MIGRWPYLPIKDAAIDTGTSFVLLKVTCSPYGINCLGLAVQDLD